MAIATHCVELLGEFLEASFIKDWEAALAVQQEIRGQENIADDLKAMCALTCLRVCFFQYPEQIC